MKLNKSITTDELIQTDYRYNYTDQELRDDWQRLCEITTYKRGSQFKPGMKLCQHFCDNFWHIENVDGLSFHKAWQDPQIMDRVRKWGLESMSELWISWIRRAVFMAAGLPNSSFYRPHFSKQIVEMSDTKTGILFDPCAGWGGRMLGTVAAGWHYIGCEPNVETYSNLQRMIQFLGIEDNVTLLNIPAETFDFKSLKGTINVVLTSPPYFNLEVYTHDTQQSYVAYNDYDSWQTMWLEPLIENSMTLLTLDGISAWNVMNFKKYDLVESVTQTHERHNFLLHSTLGFDSPLANIRPLKNRDVTYIFKRN